MKTVRDLFPVKDSLHSWQFSRLQRVTLGLIGRSLEQELLELATNIDDVDSEGMTALWWASRRDDTRAVALLINAKASVNKIDHNGWTLLQSARSLHCLELLLKAGAVAKVANRNSWTALHWVPYEWRSREDTPYSKHSEKLAVIRLLISHGADIEAKDGDGSTPLACCIAYSCETTPWTRAFLDCGANLNALDHNGDSLLNAAIFYENTNDLALLLQRGAACNLLNRNGDTLLHWAARYSSLPTLKVLEAAQLHDIDARILNEHGRTARDEAEQREPKPEGFLETFEKFLAGIRSRSRQDRDSIASGVFTDDEDSAHEDVYFDAPDKL